VLCPLDQVDLASEIDNFQDLSVTILSAMLNASAASRPEPDPYDQDLDQDHTYGLDTGLFWRL